MDEHSLRKVLEGGGGLTGSLIRVGLAGPAGLYGAAMTVRRRLYESGWLHRHRVSIPVVSIGNLTAGGTGKTPMVALLANHFICEGLRPAILLRGYRAENGRSDEAEQYRHICPDAMVLVDSDRARSAKKAEQNGAGFIILDDGFQHLRLDRDCDIVLIDATSPWGGGRTFPAGLLREPVAALRSADIAVITRCDQASGADVAAIKQQIMKYNHDIFMHTSCHRPKGLTDANGLPVSLERVASSPVVAMAGIARPEAFVETLKNLGACVVALFASGDHRNFPQQVLREAVAMAESHNALIVTTGKDQARGILPRITELFVDDRYSNKRERICVLAVEQAVEDQEGFFERVSAVIGQRRTP